MPRASAPCTRRQAPWAPSRPSPARCDGPPCLCAAQAQEQLKATQDTVKQLTDQLAQVKQEAQAKLEERDNMMREQCRSS